MILLPQWKTRFLQYFNLAAHFPVKFLLELPVAQGCSRAPLHLYNRSTTPLKLHLFPSPGVDWLQFWVSGEISFSTLDPEFCHCWSSN